jgi:hypothetical protein
MSQGEGPCRIFTLRTVLTADTPGLQYQGAGTSKILSGSKTEGSKKWGVGWCFRRFRFFVEFYWHVRMTYLSHQKTQHTEGTA